MSNSPTPLIWLWDFLIPPLRSDRKAQTTLNTLLSQERERLLTAVLRAVGILGSLTFLASFPSLATRPFSDYWDLLAVYLLLWLLVWCFALLRQISYRLRASGLSLIFYGVGVLDLVEFGLGEDGRIYLFSFSLLALILLGHRYGLLALLLSVATILFIGWQISSAQLVPNVSVGESLLPLETVITLAFTFLLNTGLIMTALYMLQRSFEMAWQRERQATGLLQQQRDKLEEHVAQRTQQLYDTAQVLREREARLRAFVNALPDIAFVLDEAGQYLEVMVSSKNPLYLQAHELKSHHFHDILTPEVANRFLAVIQKTLETEAVQIWEYPWQVETGQQWFEGRVSPMIQLAGQARSVVWVARDITERKQAEAQLEASLAEKVVLLKEIHHRVKNNLQIISSLLYLQSQDIEDDTLLAIFQESEQRLKSMALIHEQLYQTDNLAHINFAQYVSKLTTQLSRSYRRGHVQLVVNIPTLHLTIETAIPCGLIINELVTNAFKYAFPDGQAGIITITMQPTGEGQLILSVKDNGVGFPADLNWQRPKSLGLTVVKTLVKQLGGTIELQREGGADFKIIFSEKKLYKDE